MKRFGTWGAATPLLSIALSLSMLRQSVAAPTDIASSPAPVMGSARVDADLESMGEAQVSSKSGTFNYKYPISVPPGRNGVSPGVSLSYASHNPLFGDIAAGWTLNMPELVRDASQGAFAAERDGQPARWLSSLAGGRELVEVEESAPTDVVRTYRAQRDDSFTRYQQVRMGATLENFMWRALTTDGTTYEFGNYTWGLSSDWAPLRRVRDSFGNTMEYVWEPVFHPGSGIQVDTRLAAIRYGANEGAGLGHHAEVTFDYDTVLCGGALVGSALSVVGEGQLRWKGASRLRRIETSVRRTRGGTLETVRKWSLSYDDSAADCSALHSPMRLLERIAEIDPDTNEPMRPPASFAYGDLERRFDATGNLGFDTNISRVLSQGQRLHKLASWSTQRTQLMDLNGDNRPDRAYAEFEPSGPGCRIGWDRNQRAAGDDVHFSPGDTRTRVPALPWANAVPGTMGTPRGPEGCSLTGQLSFYSNKDPAGESCSREHIGNYLAYRYLDVDADGLIDLVTALHYDPAYLEPTVPPKPEDVQPHGGVCPQLDPSCTGAAWECTPTGLNDDRTCGWNTQALEVCIDAAPAEACFENAVHTRPIFKDNGEDMESIDPCLPVRRPASSGGSYRWVVYRGLGDGSFDVVNGVDVWSPIPLAAHTGDPLSSSTSSASSEVHAIVDLDGDGFLDAVQVTQRSEDETTPVWSYWRGDGLDGFHGRTADDLPFAWSVPPGSSPAASAVADNGGSGPVEAVQFSGLFDMNGDGRVNLIRAGAQGRLWVYLNHGTGLAAVGYPMPGTLGYLAASRWVPSSLGGSDGLQKSTLEPIDFDADGRLDWLLHDSGGTNLLHVNNAGLIMDSQPLPSGLALHEETWVQESMWWSVRAVVDLDGDGLVDRYRSNQPTYATEARNGQRRALMRRVDNGRGLATEVRYAPTIDGEVVEWTNTSRIDRPLWVVRALTQIDQHGADGPISAETRYHYRGAVTNQNDLGQWGFRGFEEVSVTAPRGAVSVSNYRFHLDYRGRLWQNAIFPDAASVAANTPHSITRQASANRTSIGGVVTTHLNQQASFTCLPGQSLAQCIASGAFLRQPRSYAALRNPAGEVVAWSQRNLWHANQRVGLDEDDYRELTFTSLYYGPSLYRLRLKEQQRKAYNPADGAWTTWVSRSHHYYSDDGGYLTKRRDWIRPTESADTVWTVDDATGKILTVQKPEQHASGSDAVTSYTYDEHKLFVATRTNELGHVVSYEYDTANGALLRERGPNVAGGVPQEKRFVRDAFGRPLEAWVTTTGGSGNNRLTRVATTQYLDSSIPRTSIHRRYVGPGAWAETVRQFDGHGRPLVVTEVLDGHDGVSRFHYDEDGNLVAYETPNPRGNTVNTVTYRYGYDSLGRDTFMHRPKPTDGVASGVLLSYNGLERTISECVVVADECQLVPSIELPVGTRLARKRLVFDEFGRMVEVAELRGPDEWATSAYTYDAAGRVKTMTDPEGHVTEVAHDMQGNRTLISRAGRAWRYQYDRNGNLRSKIEPVPENALASEYTSTIVYDDLDRVISRMPALRDATTEELVEYATSIERTLYDTTGNGVGRAGRHEIYGFAPTGGGPAPLLFSSEYTYDARGFVTEETRAFNLTSTGVPLADTRTLRRQFTELGGVARAWYPDAAGNATGTAVRMTYDERGLPDRLYLGASTPSWKLAQLHHNPAGKLVSVSGYRADGRLVYINRMGYDEVGRMSRQNVRSFAGLPVLNVLVEQSTVYSATDDPLAHEVTLQDAPRRRFAYDYDERHQLRLASDDRGYEAEFEYGAAGRLDTAFIGEVSGATNLVPRDVEYVYDDTDPERVARLESDDDGTTVAEYAYDEAGNVTRRNVDCGAAAPCEHRFRYDGYQRQRKVTTRDGRTEVYFYDPFGDRVLSVERDAAGRLTRGRFWFAETEVWYGAFGAQDKSLVHLAHGRTIARIENQTELEFQVHDRLGNTVLAFDADGDVTGGFNYGPFGEILDTLGDGDNHLRRFNGKEYDATSGLSYYGHRYYDALAMSWTQADPLYRFAPDSALSEPRRRNLYAFGLNSPVRFVDPDGLAPGDPFGDQIVSGISTAGTLAAALTQTPATPLGQFLWFRKNFIEGARLRDNWDKAWDAYNDKGLDEPKRIYARKSKAFYEHVSPQFLDSLEEQRDQRFAQMHLTERQVMLNSEGRKLIIQIINEMKDEWAKARGRWGLLSEYQASDEFKSKKARAEAINLDPRYWATEGPPEPSGDIEEADRRAAEILSQQALREFYRFGAEDPPRDDEEESSGTDEGQTPQ